MIEARTTEERISTSMVAGTLESRKDKMMPVDTLTAVGAAARKADPAALNVLHLHLALDKESLLSLHGRVVNRAVKEAIRLGMLSLSIPELVKLSKLAIRHWAAPICPVCSGRRYEKIKGTPMLSSRPCSACKGSGMRPMPSANSRLVVALVSWLHAIEGDIAYLVRQKLRT